MFCSNSQQKCYLPSTKYRKTFIGSRFSKIKNILSFNCSLSQKLHWKYVSLSSLSTNKVTAIPYDFWWKVSRPNIAKVSYMPKIELLITNYGREQLLILNTANKTVEACPEWVSAFIGSTPINHNVGIVCPLPPHTNHNVGQRDPNSWRTRSLAKSRRAWMTASALLTSQTKKWNYWRVESAPTPAYVVSREWPHLTRVIQAHLSIPGSASCYKILDSQTSFTLC